MADPLLTPEQIVEIALEPAESASDGQSAKARPISEIKEALELAEAVRTPRRSGWRNFSVGIPPSATGRP